MATKLHKEITDAEVHPTISDDDNDTRVMCEESADEDVIRFDIAGTEKAKLDSSAYYIDTIAEKTADTGITIDGAKIKDHWAKKNLRVDYGGDLAAAITAIGATETTLVIDDTVTLAASATQPSTLTFEKTRDGIFTGAYTLTLNGGLIGDMTSQWFNNSVTVTGLVWARPEMFGEVWSESTDYAEAILDMYNALRASGGLAVFRGVTYLVSYGWLIPSNTATYLHGCKIKATTTWGQDSIPTNGTTRAQFAIMGSLTNGATMSTDVQNVAVIGDSAEIDMRYDEQTGSPPGASGVYIATTPAPIVGNLWAVHDIEISNLKISNSMWYGTYVEGVKNITLKNVDCYKPANLGHVIVCGWNVHYDWCRASEAQERSANQGTGFWNEVNETWQFLRNITYKKCLAELNTSSGFRYYNDGKDVEVSIFVEGNISRFNSWNGSAQVSATAEAGHVINKSLTGTAEFIIQLDNCIAEEEYNSGFKVIRVAGGTDEQRIIFNNPVALNCNKEDLDSHIRSPIHIGGVNNDSPVFINNPVIIAPAANTLGYGIGLEYSQNVFVNDPIYIGTFTYKLLTSNTPATRFNSGVPYAGWDIAYDEITGGHTGGGTEFYKPIRLPSADQTNEPTEFLDNELFIWQDDNDQFTGIYKRDDSATLKYIDIQAKKRIRVVEAYGGATISSGSPATGTVTVTGAALGDIIHLSYNQDLQNGGAGPILFGNVTTTDTVRWTIANTHSSSRVIPAGNIIITVIGHEF